MTQSERALYRATKDPEAATPIKPQPVPEHNKLQRMFCRVKHAISSNTKDINDIGAVYLFDDEEADRMGIDGQCCRFEDGTVTIGLYVGIMNEPEYATMVLLYEIAHLKCWEHNKVFHDYLDKLIEVYNKATGSMIENDYVGLGKGYRKDSKDDMH